MKFAISQPTVVRLPRDEKQTYRFELWASNLTMGLTLAMTLIFEFSRSYMILTIWWPRSSLRIYQIVTGVTSVVGVPSTHLVSYHVITILQFSVWPQQSGTTGRGLLCCQRPWPQGQERTPGLVRAVATFWVSCTLWRRSGCEYG